MSSLSPWLWVEEKYKAIAYVRHWGRTVNWFQVEPTMLALLAVTTDRPKHYRT